VGPIAGLDVVTRENLNSCRESNPDRPVHGQALFRLSYPGSHLTNKGKVKVVPVLFLTGHHAMKAYLGVEI
jgi:hypothetical protein